MTDEYAAWVAFWLCVGSVLVALILGAFMYGRAVNAQNTYRDEYYASHCKVVQQIVSTDGTSSTRKYSCE